MISSDIRSIMSELVIVLPSDLQVDSDLVLVSLLHPRTGVSCKFLRSAQAVYEITAISGSLPHTNPQGVQKALNEARSILFTHGKARSGATVLVATKINPLFFALPILDQHGRDRFITSENIEDYMDAMAEPKKCESLAVSYFEPKLSLVCESRTAANGSMAYKLDSEKLVSLLNKLKTRVTENLPKNLIKIHVDDKISPADITKTAPETIRQAALEQLSFYFVSTYLNATLTNELLLAQNFKQLDSYLEELAAANEAVRETQRALSENTNAGPPSKTKGSSKLIKRKAPVKRAQPVADKRFQKSITDMFGIKPKA